MKRAIRHARTVLGWAALGLAAIRVALAIIRLAGAGGTIDAVANAAGWGDVVAPFELWFDEWVTHPAMEMIGLTPTPIPDPGPRPF